MSCRSKVPAQRIALTRQFVVDVGYAPILIWRTDEAEGVAGRLG